MTTRTALLNLVLLLATVLGIVIVGTAGSGLKAPPPAAGQPTYDALGTETAAHSLAHVRLVIAVVLLVAHAMGGIFRRLGQPRVLGEMLAGILLGPSLFGHLMPDAAAFLLPRAIEGG